jgi:ABC-type multidrug transport system fused ATPase/permease subunit
MAIRDESRWGEWAWLWREMRPYAWYQLASLACIITSTSVGLIQPLLVKWLVDEILPNRRWGALGVLTGLLLACGIGRSLLMSLGQLVSMLAVKRMTFRTRLRFTRHVLSLSPEFHARNPVGDVQQRLERDVALVGDLGSDVLPSIVRVVVETSLALAVMTYLDWRLTSITVPLVVLFGYVRQRYRLVLQKGAENVREANGRESSLLQEMLTGVTQIQVLGAERRLLRSYARLGLRTARREVVQRKHELMFTTLSMSIIGIGVAVIVGYGGVRVFLGGLSLGGLVAFYGYIGTIFSPMSLAVGLYAQVIRVRASVRRLMDIEQAPQVVADCPDPLPVAETPREIACVDVSFGYAPGQHVLRRVRFRARAGERIAIVGESGCGKSSLLRLFPRLYEPREGTVLLDGCDVRALPLGGLRRVISYVPQDPVLFQGTLLQNLRFAQPNATREEIEHAAWTACLTDVVDRLPLRWDTELGPMGSGLSGGEKQRLAITRALLQRRPILVLDEAASALDSATEHKLLSRLESWSASRIVIFVSHRLATAQWADRVVVLRRGEIVEDGHHDILYRPDTHYGALWRYIASRTEERAHESA